QRLVPHVIRVSVYFASATGLAVSFTSACGSVASYTLYSIVGGGGPSECGGRTASVAGRAGGVVGPRAPVSRPGEGIVGAAGGGGGGASGTTTRFDTGPFLPRVEMPTTA